jgi:ketosteroid isomerase-like protein
VSERGKALVLRMIEAVNRGDGEAIKAEVAADFELHPLISVWERAYRGHEGVDDWRRDLAQLWEEFTIQADRLEDAGDDAVIVVGSWRGTPRSGPTPLEGPIAVVVWIAGEQVRRADVYLNEDEAARAAGSV